MDKLPVLSFRSSEKRETIEVILEQFAERLNEAEQVFTEALSDEK